VIILKRREVLGYFWSGFVNVFPSQTKPKADEMNGGLKRERIKEESNW